MRLAFRKEAHDTPLLFSGQLARSFLKFNTVTSPPLWAEHGHSLLKVYYTAINTGFDFRG
jgi:hypothetical protein